MSKAFRHSASRVACRVAGRRRLEGERGQALVEFAMILGPLLLLVSGIIWFGIGLNYWLDMQRIANQGARWAVVNQWPGCPRTAAAGSCTATPPCDSANKTGQTLENHLRCQALTQGLRNEVQVSICYPDDGDTTTMPGSVGTPVRVQLRGRFDVVPLLRWEGLEVELHARATMRLEQNPTHLGPPPPPSCNPPPP